MGAFLSPDRPFRFLLCAAILAFAPIGSLSGSAIAQGRQAASASGPDPLSAVVRVRTRALPDAHTSATLGSGREGSGVIIDGNGLVLTIGYLILEASEVEVTDSRGKTLPATVVGYDHATGFGLVRTLAPPAGTPIELGDSSKVEEKQDVMIAGFGGAEAVAVGTVVSRREFTGSWEYLLESAIFTSPPVFNWGGAALIGKDGRLLGIGSLLVRDAMAPGFPFPGNMFVPIDLLKPILKDLIDSGRVSGPARPWLGLSTEEIYGTLIVSRVSPESPAAKAGLKPYDIVVGVAGKKVEGRADFYRTLWSQGPAGTEVDLKVYRDSREWEVKVRSVNRLDYLKVKPAY